MPFQDVIGAVPDRPGGAALLMIDLINGWISEAATRRRATVEIGLGHPERSRIIEAHSSDDGPGHGITRRLAPRKNDDFA